MFFPIFSFISYSSSFYFNLSHLLFLSFPFSYFPPPPFALSPLLFLFLRNLFLLISIFLPLSIPLFLLFISLECPDPHEYKD